MPSAYWEKEGQLVRTGLRAYFSAIGADSRVISLVGGGGKTTLLYALAAHYRDLGMRAAIMTTTRMGCPQRWCETIEACRACWDAGEYAVCGRRLENGKFRAPDEQTLEQLLAAADAVIIEADGAHRKACKAPAEHEPVLIPQTDTVIGVMGLDVLGQTVDAACHRAQYVQALLGCGGDHVLTAQDLARILLSDRGTRKGVGSRSYYVMLTKCDDAQRLEGGVAVLEALKAQGHTRSALTYYPPEHRAKENI